MSLDAPAPTLYWEDFPIGFTAEFGRKEVTRDEIVDFARQFDPQPFHLDDEAARHSLFGGLCASGWHTAAMAMRMMCDAHMRHVASLGSPGLENLRWKKPVFPGDVLRMRHQVLEARTMTSRPHVGMLLSRWEVFNQRYELVMSMEAWGMYRRRDEPPPAPAAAG